MKIKTKINTTIKNIKLMKFLKKTLNYSFFSFILFFFLPNSSFAAVAVDSSALGEILSGLVASIGAILGLLTGLISLFLNPGWTSGSIFGLTGYLKEMWILVSNVVYFIFAGILIVIAFMNIVGKGTDKFELKQSLPKFIVGILIVPFSWFLVQFILSISAILTVSVLTIPYDTFAPTFDKVSDKAIEGLCKKMIFHIQGATGALSTTKGAGAAKNSDSFGKTFECVEGSGKVTFKDIVSGKNGNSQNLYGIISIYTFGIMELGELDKISISQLSGIESIMKLSAKTIFDLAFIIIYLILMVALFLALFTRGMWLWMYAMMSPLFGLMYFLGDKGGETLKKFNFKEFFALAMVPVLVSAALSFGLLFIFVAGQGLSTNSVDGNSSGDKIYSKDGLNLGFMTLQFEGESGNTKDAGSFISALFNGTMNTVGWLMIKTFGLALLWVAVLAALNYSSIIKTVIEPIDKFGKSVGSLAMSAPKYMPIPGTNGLSAQGLSQVGAQATSSMDRMSNIGAQRFMERHGLFKDTAGFQNSFNKLTTDLSAANKSVSLEAKAISEALKFDKLEQYVTNSSAISKFNEIGKDLKGSEWKEIKIADKDSFAQGMRDIHNAYINKGVPSGIGLGNQIKNDIELDTWTELVTKISKSSPVTNNNTMNISLGGDKVVNTATGKFEPGVMGAVVSAVYEQIQFGGGSISENVLISKLKSQFITNESEIDKFIIELKKKFEDDQTSKGGKLKGDDFIKKDAPQS